MLLRQAAAAAGRGQQQFFVGDAVDAECYMYVSTNKHAQTCPIPLTHDTNEDPSTIIYF
jgi:hypothetical protein